MKNNKIKIVEKSILVLTNCDIKHVRKRRFFTELSRVIKFKVVMSNSCEYI